jgi:hypothetical protein
MVKDAVMGLPRDMQARLLQTMGEARLLRANAKARRFAIAVLVLDLALLDLGNSVIQSAVDMWREDKSLSQELRGYVDRFGKEMKHLAGSPASALNPFAILQSLTPMGEHEPGKENRILIGYEKNGTGIYLRNPFGKAIEDVQDYFTQPLQTLKSMMSPYARALYGLTGRDTSDNMIWDPYASTPGAVLEALGDYVKYVLEGAGPATAIEAAHKLATGSGDKFQAAQIAGGALGLSISHGYPGGPARGEIHLLQKEHQFQVDKAIPKVMELAKQGDTKGAIDIMTKLGMKPQQQRAIIFQAKQPHATVKQLQDVMRFATPEERGRVQERLQEDRERRAQ